MHALVEHLRHGVKVYITSIGNENQNVLSAIWSLLSLLNTVLLAPASGGNTGFMKAFLQEILLASFPVLPRFLFFGF